MSKEAIINTFKDYGYTDEAIAGILGNIAVETGGTYDPNTKQVGGAGYGAFQFDYMKPFYKKWLKENKKKDSLNSQLGFFHDTIFGDSTDIIGAGNAEKIRTVLEGGSPADVAQTLTALWFRPGKPHLDRRLAHSENEYKTLNQMKDTQPEEEPFYNELLQGVKKGGSWVGDTLRDAGNIVKNFF